MFSRRNFLQLTSSAGAGLKLPELSDAVKTEIVAGIGRIIKARDLLSTDSIFCLHCDFSTVISGLGDSDFSIYVGSALKYAAKALKETPCLAIPFIDLYSRPHSDPILGSSANRDPDWPVNKIAEISNPPQFMLNSEISGHYNYASKCLKKYGVLSNSQTVERYIELHNKYRSSLELALQSPEVANWLCECPHNDVLSELHRMFGVHRGVSSLVRDLKTLLSHSGKSHPLMRELSGKLVGGQYDQIIDHPLVLACERLADLSHTGIRHSGQVEQIQGARRDLDYLAEHGVELDPEDSILRRLDQWELESEEGAKSAAKQKQKFEDYTPNGTVRTIKNSITVSELGAKPLKDDFRRTNSGYWVDKNGVYLVLPKVNKKDP